MPGRLERWLRGPHLQLPRPLDALSDWWAGRPPRIRAVLAAGALLACLAAAEAHVRTVQSRWGGPAVDVLVATRALSVGSEATAVRRVAVPPPLVPPRAVSPGEQTGILALALPEGTVLTHAHFDERGPAAGLPPGMRALPVPTEPGWGVTPGGWVDVWTLGAGDGPSRLVARSRPVLHLTEDSTGLTSLIGLSAPEAEAVTAGMAVGRVLLASAPAPPRR